ncbi:MAG: radical SAM family heme chaperone HemW [Hyphomonadaceae bacterium]
MSAFGIYVHWPYCTAICPYCDFNVYRARGDTHAALIAAIETDIRAHAARFGARAVGSIFFGGGTPSLLRGEDIARLIAAIGDAYVVGPDCEITLECNPEDAASFAEHVGAGVTRLSVGVQSLDEDALKRLGRKHDVHSAVAAVDRAADSGARVSIDLIYAREGQSIEAWRAELVRALALPIEHASLYQLTVDEGTALQRRVMRGAASVPDTDLAAEFFALTQEEAGRAGFPAYEISNHARSPTAQAQHNLLYWRSDDWIGVGPGAHGRVTHAGVRVALEAQRRPADYIDAVRENGLGLITETPLTLAEVADEMLMMGLRIQEGLDLPRLEALRGAPFKADALRWLIEQGLVTQDQGRLRLTPQGRPLANRIAAELAF